MTPWGAVARRIRVPLGFATAVVFLILAKPTAQSMLIGGIVLLPGLLMRGLASGHVRKNEALATTGPYAYTRNPLYLGSMILALGFAVAARSWWIAILMCGMFLAIYLPVIRGEETYLGQRFPEFAEYSRAVPRFIPRFRSFRNHNRAFSWELYSKHREYNSAVGSLAMLAALAIKWMWISRST